MPIWVRIVIGILLLIINVLGYYLIWRAAAPQDLRESHKKLLKTCIPLEELPPFFRGERNHSDMEYVRSCENAETPADSSQNRLPLPEEERTHPYYQRTGQILCNSRVRTSEALSDGSWYGFDELLQDLIAGRHYDIVFHRPEEPERENKEK